MQFFSSVPQGRRDQIAGLRIQIAVKGVNGFVIAMKWKIESQSEYEHMVISVCDLLSQSRGERTKHKVGPLSYLTPNAVSPEVTSKALRMLSVNDLEETRVRFLICGQPLGSIRTPN